jgi:predicted Zn-dependent peptidase
LKEGVLCEIMKPLKDMNHHHYKLKNGLNVVIVPIGEVESATTLIMVGAGSRYETKENNGISHFLEHMAFKGTKKRPTAIEISSLIDGIGAESNAFTGKEYTGYYIKSTSTKIELSLDILSDMVKNLLLDPKEIDKERGVILEEKNMYEDTPSRKIGDVFEELLYGDVPMGWDIVGTKENINRITREDFLAYMKKYYSADNMTLVVAGKVDTEEIKGKIEEYFADFEIFPTQEALPVMEDQKKPAVSIKYKKTDQAHIALGFRTVGLLNEEDRYPLSLLSSILGGGMSSRLFHEVRERRGLAYSVRTIEDSSIDCGYLATFAGVDPKRITEAIQVILEEYNKIKNVGEITEEELTKAKEYSKGHFVLDLEDTRSVAVFYASALLLEKKMDNPPDIIAKIDAVTLADINRVIKKYFSLPLNLAIIGDFKDSAPFEKLLE